MYVTSREAASRWGVSHPRRACRAPAPPDNAIVRRRLLDAIAVPGKGVTYIHAPAGYGKTTLLAQYAAGRRDVVWLTIDERDSDPFSFLGHLEAAVREVLREFEFHATDYMPLIGRAGFAKVAVDELLRAIGRRGVTVILDNVHLCSGEVTREFLAEWVRACPPDHAIIMASRHEPWGGLLQARLEGRVRELTRADLRFSREEAAELWGFFDEPAYSATEGWALGVQSYRVAVQGNPEIAASRLRAHRDIHRYLMDEIVRRLPPDVRRFLFRTCLLPDLDARVCDDLLGIRNSPEILEELAHRNVFTVRVSASRYRYHALFREFLRQNDGGAGLETVRRAMTCAYDAGDYERAIDYAMLADDARVVHDCIAALVGRQFATGKYQRLKDYFDFLGSHDIPLSPPVLLAKGMYLSSRGLFTEAEACLSAAAGCAGSENPVVYLHATLHRARILRNRTSFDESTRCIDGLLPLLKGHPMPVWYTVVIEKIYNLTVTSRLAEALDLTRAMIEECSVRGDVRVKAWFERYLTVIYFYMGDHLRSIKAYEKSLSIPEDEQDWLRRHSVAAYAAMAYQATGDEEEAFRLVDEETERLRQLGLYEEMSINYLVCAQILGMAEMRRVHRGEPADFAGSSHYVDLAEEYATLNRSTRDYLVIARILKACGRLLSRPEDIARTIDEILPMLDSVAPFFRALAYWRMADALALFGVELERAMKYCRRCVEVGEECGSRCFAAPARGEAAAILLKAGDEAAAVEEARRCMEVSMETGGRYFFRFADVFGPVLKLAAEHGVTPDFTREMIEYGGYRARRVFVHMLGCFYIAADDDRGSRVKIRTRKARELLAYMIEHRNGVTGRRICSDLWADSEGDANRLFHTRRGEVKRAFASLGAGNPIVYENGMYRLCMDETACDFDAFSEAASRFERQPTPENARRVVELYGGRYLDDMEALWAEATRMWCEEVCLKAAQVLGRQAKVAPGAVE